MASQSRRRLAEMERPSGVVTIRDILDEKFAVGRMVSVVGLVKDMRAPMPTRGTGKNHSAPAAIRLGPAPDLV
jgi:hypothetical protein